MKYSAKIGIRNGRKIAACAALGLGLLLGGVGKAQTPPPGLPPGVQDVVKLTKAGMTEDVIMAQIRNAGATYNLNADQLIYLSNQGVSQTVIRALISIPGSTAPIPAPGPVPPPANIPPPGGPGMATPPPGVEATAAPNGPVNYDYFHDRLAPFGTWVQVSGYGWCWRPSVLTADPSWRPYTRGHWIYTDTGWYWQSDYPWGDIAFHYGRWMPDGFGWVWVPGYDWAPAWVCWRHSDGYIGWAPLPPAAVFRVGVGLEFGGHVALNVGFGLSAGAFTFVGYDHFWDHNFHAYIVPRDRVDVIFGHSEIYNGYRMDHGRFIVDGFGRDRIGAWTHHDVRVEAPVVHDERIQRHMVAEGRPFRDDQRDGRDYRGH